MVSYLNYTNKSDLCDLLFLYHGFNNLTPPLQPPIPHPIPTSVFSQSYHAYPIGTYKEHGVFCFFSLKNNEPKILQINRDLLCSILSIFGKKDGV